MTRVVGRKAQGHRQGGEVGGGVERDRWTRIGEDGRTRVGWKVGEDVSVPERSMGVDRLLSKLDWGELAVKGFERYLHGEDQCSWRFFMSRIPSCSAIPT